MLDEVNVPVDCVDLSSAVESNGMSMESPAMASYDQSSSLGSGQSDLVAVGNAMILQICQASSQNSAQTDTSLKAHDYIGLCEVSSRAVRAEASAMNEQQQNMVVNLQETELRLGRRESEVFGAAVGQSSMVASAPDQAFFQSIVRPCENPEKEISVGKFVKEVGDAGIQKSFGKSESFKRRCVEDSVKVWDLGIGLSSKSVAYPQEEVGENKVSFNNVRILKMCALDSKEKLTDQKALAPLESFEDEQKLLPTKSAGKQQLDMESAKQKQLLQISVKGQAEYGVFGHKTPPPVPQERGSSHLQKLNAAHSFWQPHMMVRAPEATHCPKNNEPQSAHYSQDLETSSASFKGALDCMTGAKALPTTPKHGMVGAKRVFSEAIGSGETVLNGTAKAINSEVMGVADSESKLFNQQLKHQLPSSMFSWGSSKRPLASWSLGLNRPDGAAAPFGPFLSPGKSLLKGDANILPQKHCYEALPEKSLGQGSPPELGHGMQNAQTTAEDDSTAAPPRAVVGWPPVQSFRKNSFRPPKPKKLVASSSTLAPVLTQLTQSERLFVKVYMDGLPIGRKVDLRTVNNYDKLSVALEEMFKGFINGQSGDKGQGDPFCTREKKLNFLCNSEYAIAYEDKDGDLMLVGDVPWGMFIVTVKRLRIMKGSGAIGLSPRPSDKVKCS